MSKLLGDLNPNPENPRRITDEKLEQLKKSLAEYGDLSGFVYNRKTNRFVGGHQRQKALPQDSKLIIEKSYETPTKTGTTMIGSVLVDGELFSYREVDWEDLREKAANIAANKGGGEWDYPKLTEWMNELDSNNYDLDLTMFDEAERERLLGGWDSDISAIDKIEENLDGIKGKITITCPQDLKDEVLIYLKSKLLETSFEGVHIE